MDTTQGLLASRCGAVSVHDEIGMSAKLLPQLVGPLDGIQQT